MSTQGGSNVSWNPSTVERYALLAAHYGQQAFMIGFLITVLDLLTEGDGLLSYHVLVVFLSGYAVCRLALVFRASTIASKSRQGKPTSYWGILVLFGAYVGLSVLYYRYTSRTVFDFTIYSIIIMYLLQRTSYSFNSTFTISS